MSENLTLKSIGDACGVSHITVSRALRGDRSVKPETAKRIREYSARVGYKPNPLARSLASARSGSFHLASSRSIIIPYNEEGLLQSGEALFWDYVEGAVKAASSAKSSVEVMGFNRSLPEFDFIRTLVEGERVAGILDFGLLPETIRFLHSHSIPLVSRLQSVKQIGDRNNATVYPDHIQGYVLAWRYLLEKGHREIGYIVQKNDGPHLKACLAATHLLESDPQIKTTLHVSRYPTSEEIKATLKKSFPKGEGIPTVFFCSNDEVAHQTVVAFDELGFRVPRDISIFGFDDSSAARFCNPPICTIRNPRREIGRAMFNLLRDIIAGRPDSRTRVEVLPMELMARKSVASLDRQTSPKMPMTFS